MWKTSSNYYYDRKHLHTGFFPHGFFCT